jgi:hypothetical protein
MQFNAILSFLDTNLAPLFDKIFFQIPPFINFSTSPDNLFSGLDTFSIGVNTKLKARQAKQDFHFWLLIYLKKEQV